MTAEQRNPIPDFPPTAEELLAAARFAVPEPNAMHLSRPRLLHLLSHAQVPVVLVSGPAGSGKTSLAAEWVRGSGGEGALVGWITFEEGDTTFWRYLADCLRRLDLEVPSQVITGTEDSTARTKALLALAASITEAPERCTVVVDGYEMTSLDVARDVDFLLRHTFGRLRLVFVTRVDPVLPLYRYRLTDSVVEVRAADLAFSDQEAAQLLELLGVRLSDESIQELNARVKGWGAGLRFAAQALAAQRGSEQSVGAVLAQPENINEFLVGEVLDAQTPEVRRFMLDTCVPDILCPGLVEELAGAGARHSLAALARANVFIEVLSERPDCYAYYPFFRNLLRAQLAYESPERYAELQLITARWLKRQGLVEKAIEHLAAISAWGEVAVQIVDSLLVGRLVLEGGQGPLSVVARQIPEDDLQRAAGVVRAALALRVGDRVACAAELSRVRRAVGFDGARDDAVALTVAVLDAVRACVADESGIANALAAEALRVLDKTHIESGEPGSELSALVKFGQGMALLRQGDLRPARTALGKAAASDAGRSFPWFRANCLGYVALVDALEGRLTRASNAAVESLGLLNDAGLPLKDRSPAPYVALARVSLDRCELKAARGHVVSAMACRALPSNHVTRGITEAVVAALERANGHLQPALERLDAAADAAGNSDPWLSDYLRVEAARLLVAGGQAENALREVDVVGRQGWAEKALVAAAAYAELGKAAAVDQALALVVDPDPPLRVKVARLLVQVVEESRGRSPERARVVLDRALRLAAPERLRRPFREAGPSVQRLLAADVRLLAQHPWLDPAAGSRAVPAQRTTAGPSVESVPRQPRSQLVEPLTAKEQEVLGHLEELLSTDEIAEKMFVSVNTVRTHIRSILRKLGVNRRNAAVRKARELGLVQQ